MENHLSLEGLTSLEREPDGDRVPLDEGKAEVDGQPDLERNDIRLTLHRVGKKEEL